MTVEELKTMIGKFGNTDQLAMSGLSIGQKKYMYISSTEKVIRLKKGTSGCHIIKTGQTFIVCRYNEPIMPEQAAMVTEKLGDYLIEVGF